MSILSKAFDAIKHTLHWGPAVEPFHQAVIAEHDALEARVAKLESELASMFPPRSADAPNYITEPAAVVEPEQAAVAAVHAAVPDDADSISDDEHDADQAQQNPAEPAIKGVPDLLSLKPDQVPAGPDTEAEPAAAPDEE